MKLFIRVFIILIVVALITTSFIFFQIRYHAGSCSPERSDVIIVLGCQIRGRTPSLSLLYRLQKALELYENGYASYIIVSGGQGADEVTSESEIMKEWLVREGIESNVIIEENRSTSTFENLKFSKSIMEEKKFGSAIIVSNDFHMYRSITIAKRLNMEISGAPAQTVDYLAFYYNSREILSVVKSFIFDR